jgi:DNA repair exonuclease SbcCD ATPase subunit
MAKNKIEKRKFIEDIFGMEVFSTMLTTLRNEYNEIKREHDTELTKLDEVSKSLKNYSNQKDKLLQKRKDKKELYQSRQANNKKELEKLVEEIQNYEEINVENIQNSIDSLNERLEDCETKMSDDISQISSEKAKVKYKKEQYKKIGTDEEICPVCLRSIEEHDQDLILKEKEKLKSSIELMVESIASCLENLDELKKRKVKILSAITACHNKIAEAKVTLQKRKGTKERVSQLEEWLDELKIDLEAVESTETDFDNLIVDTKKRFDSLENTVKEYRDQISTLDIVKFVVSEEGVKSYIVNKLLELLNGKLLHYLKRLDSNSICIFNEYFEEEILNEKNKICSYFNFSGAERKSIDLACLFTFSDIRRLQGGVQYNIAIYDELFDSSFDEKGIELITEILRDRVEELDECSIVISHRKESIKAVTGDVIYLEKENGITKRVDYKEM